MNYRLAFVFSYERFKNTLICIISVEPSTRFRPILNFPIFRQNGASLELLNIVFNNSLLKGFYWWNKKKTEFFYLAPDSRPSYPGYQRFFSRASGSFVLSAAGRQVFGQRPKKRAGHFLRLDRNRKPRMKSLWHPGYDPHGRVPRHGLRTTYKKSVLLLAHILN